VSYAAFLEAKRHRSDLHGFDPDDLPEFLFGFQRHLVDWSIRRGRAAIFADCGLGKTPMELVWADAVHRHTGQPVIIATPLAVGFQFVAEAEKFGIDAAMSRDGTAAGAITITNYEQLEKFDPFEFAGMVCDESSAIKAFDGVRRAVVTDMMRKMRYRLLGTATAAPNDYIELGTSSEALGELGHVDMLNRFFTNKNRTGAVGGTDSKQGSYRLKGHASEPFWRWIASWARAVRKPSDLGFDDDGFVLPELIERVTKVDPSTPRDGQLFDTPSVGFREEREEVRRTIRERCETAAALLADASPGVAWCHLNDESRMLADMIDGAVELTGSDSVDEKEAKLSAFSRGEIRVLVTKPSIGAWGLNWQHCHRMTFFPSHSYEQYYQAVRRAWRFGQTEPVTVDLVTTAGGSRTLANMQAKAAQADEMFARLIANMDEAVAITHSNNHVTDMEVPAWLS
jgi:hypothetical protein